MALEGKIKAPAQLRVTELFNSVRQGFCHLTELATVFCLPTLSRELKSRVYHLLSFIRKFN